MALTPAVVARAFAAACRAELDALKPGNVHRFAAGHAMEPAHFEAAAAASAPFIGAPSLTVGARIARAVDAARAASGLNANLGIVLLCAPLAQAALAPAPAPLRARLAQVLAGLDLDDAREAFGAIARANPGGLGAAPEADVRAPATLPLGAAMALAAHRDTIARQYGTGFADVFERGLPLLADDPLAPARLEAAFLAFLAALPDSHIARKFGADAAEAVRQEAAAVQSQIDGLPATDRHACLLAFDARLKAKGLNPGTSADLTVASAFAALLDAAEAGAVQPPSA
ncbi:triphosphoribosyl-dephospho-CoA synthase [Xanthobacter sp. KR7-225]|uniref:triphosphoribosyl-dephospho-CoA synthase n=1 Tax=Xanthobacter sp. KR7-225 TaxID=3156613 RepID=UPI0032B44F26